MLSAEVQTRPATTDYQRLPALDALRGIVIVLMAVHHASFAFNAGKYATDPAAFYKAGAPIPELQFLIRWVTHICAPTFLFLAGMALCLSITGRQSRGASEGEVDRHLLIRGLIILLLDPLWMSIGFGYGVFFQVLYVIGGSMIVMIGLRRLPPRLFLIVGLGYMVFSEVFAGLALWISGGERAGPVGAFLFTGGVITDGVFVLYPLLPWLAYMVLGWSIGNMLMTNRIRRPVRFYSIAGFISIIMFLILRGLNGYGNMVLCRYGSSLVQWLHVSKYPPMTTAREFSWTASGQGAFQRRKQKSSSGPRSWRHPPSFAAGMVTIRKNGRNSNPATLRSWTVILTW